ncbi:MAG: hypothetical protein HKO65_14500 [Gemmatimonadetes bacterium]|nr:hypothetical protein [Gemmatimonadota bacterium]NNM06298.1 hypothetical protein [Gemmatimonadota bacterium]
MRKIRGGLGTAITWAVTWGLGGFGLYSLLHLVTPGPGYFIPGVLSVVGISALSGFVGGTTFSTVLSTFYSRRSLKDLNPAGMGMWGTLCGLLVPAGIFGIGSLVGLGFEVAVGTITLAAMGTFGALTGYGTIKLAQSGQPKLEEGDSDWMLDSGE